MRRRPGTRHWEGRWEAQDALFRMQRSTFANFALLRHLGFWYRLLQRQVGFRPAISTVGIPDDVGVSHDEDSFCRIPRHPAIAQTVDYECLGLITSSHAREIGSQVILG